MTETASPLGHAPPAKAQSEPCGGDSRRPGEPALLGEWIVRVAGSYALLGGVLTFLGWVLDVPRLMDWTGGGITMKANAALCAASGGLALWLTFWSKAKLLLRICGGMVLLIGSLTLVEHLFSWNFGIDTLFFTEAPGAAATAAPGRMGPPASTSFTLLGLALMLLSGGPLQRKWAPRLAILVICIASLSLAGFFFGASQLFHVARVTGIAFQTATMIFVLGLGLVFAVPDHNMANALRRQDAGGLLLRRLILPIIVLPLMIGWFRLQGEAIGLYDGPFGTAARTVTEIILLIAVLWWTARGLSASDAAFRMSEAELKEAQQLAHIGGWRWIPETDATIASAELYHIFGLNRSEAFPAFKEQRGTIYPVRAWDQINAASQRAMQSGEGYSIDVDAFRNGERIHVSARGEPVRDGSGRITGLRGTVQDITERKAAEEVIRQRERELAAANEQLALRAEHLDQLVEQRTAKLKELVGDLEAFSYSMAHDLRGPIRTIEGFADLLIDEYESKLDTAGKDYLDRIRSASERMHRLITDVLTYTRITHELLPVEPISVNTILMEVIEHYPTLKEANIRVTSDLPVVMANRNGLTQVLSNLLTNAVKFAPPDRAACVEVSAERNGGFVILSVKDDGIGIAPEHHARIFQMFERLHHEKDYEGTGIGLAVVRRIVERMGGTISLESKLGKGSRFMVRLREGQFPEYRPAGQEESKRPVSASSKQTSAVILLLAFFGLGLIGVNAAEKEANYTTVRREKYPCTLHVIKVPRSDRRWEIRSLHADGKALGLEELTSQIKRPKDLRPIAAVNGDYYVRQGFFAGDPRGLQISRGELISAPAEGASFWIDALDGPNVGITVAKFSVQWPDGSAAPLELNADGKDNGIVLFTAAIGSELKSRGGTEVILERDGNSPWVPLRPGRIYSAIIADQMKGTKVPLTTNQLVLSIGRRAKAPKLESGAVLKISTITEPSLRGVSEAISGGPILVREGKRVPIKSVDSDSYIFSSMSESHPRSAIGWNDDYYFLVSADGRHGNVSVGLTLEEFSSELLKLGCENAMNLDGGGSATLWFQGKVRNYLCDRYERKIANVLAIVEKI